MAEIIFPTVDDSPLATFEAWYACAQEAIAKDPNAMSVSTCGADGQPSVRIVLLRDYGPEGFVFYTNYSSDKSDDLLANPKVELMFYWPQLDVQIRISGVAEKTSELESDAYFGTRHPRSRRGAWASDQSSPLANHEALMKSLESYEAQYPDDESIPRPPHWGGWRVMPTAFEFWQSEPNRLHKRMRFTPKNDAWQGEWVNP